MQLKLFVFHFLHFETIITHSEEIFSGMNMYFIVKSQLTPKMILVARISGCTSAVSLATSPATTTTTTAAMFKKFQT